MITQEITLNACDILRKGYMDVIVQGTAPLMPHRFWKQIQLQEKMAGKAGVGKGKPPRDYEREALESLYFVGRRPKSWQDLQKNHEKYRYGFSLMAVKNSLVASAIDVAKTADLPQTRLRRWLWVTAPPGDQIEIISQAPPALDIRPARNDGKSRSIDLRSRPMFAPGWESTFTVAFDCDQISTDQMLKLIAAAGANNGWGEMRPAGVKSSGTFGTFEIIKAQVRLPDDIGKMGGESGDLSKKPSKEKVKA